MATAPVRPSPSQVELAKLSLARKRLRDFVEQAWPILEPATEFKSNWHIDCICEHLEAMTRGDIKKLILNVPPGSMKPVHCDEYVSTSLGIKRLGDTSIGDMVLTHRGRFRAITAIHEQGSLPIVRITTQSGRVVRAAPDHPFLTPRGWIAAGDLTPGDYAGIPSFPDEFGDSSVTPEEARLLGYLVGDGCISNRNLTFANTEDEIIQDFARCAQSVGFYTGPHEHGRVTLRSTKDRHIAKTEPPVLTWLRSHGLYRSNSYTKRIPPAIFRSGPIAIANFIGAYWSCDGMITVRHTNNKTTLLVSATTVSQELASDVQMALAHINIQARVRRKARILSSTKQPGGEYISYDVVTSRRHEVAKFAQMPGLIERKRVIADQAFLEFFPTDLFADEIISVEPDGVAECRCLTVDEDSSFTANGLAVHNSLLACVFWPAWEWIQNPSQRWLYGTYKADLAHRDANKMRDLIGSEWYQRRFGHIFQIRKDQDSSGKFANDKTGSRVSAGVSSVTGQRGNRIVWDDPHNIEKAESAVQRNEVINSWRTTWSERVSSEETSSRLIIMQRLHQEDICGFLLELGGWEHLSIPTEYEGQKYFPTSLNWEDPRNNDGDLLWPHHVGTEAVADKKKTLGPYGWAGQHQQRPAPREGAQFKEEWFQIVDAVPAIAHRVRAWDNASTAGAGDYTVGVLMAKTLDGLYWIEDVVRGQWDATERDRVKRETAKKDHEKYDGRVRIWDVQDPGAAGKDAAAASVRNLAGYAVQTEYRSGDKETNADPMRSQAGAGNFRMLRADWNKAYIEVMILFPFGKYDDDVDASSFAFSKLAKLNALASNWRDKMKLNYHLGFGRKP